MPHYCHAAPAAGRRFPPHTTICARQRSRPLRPSSALTGGLARPGSTTGQGAFHPDETRNLKTTSEHARLHTGTRAVKNTQIGTTDAGEPSTRRPAARRSPRSVALDTVRPADDLPSIAAAIRAPGPDLRQSLSMTQRQSRRNAVQWQPSKLTVRARFPRTHPRARHAPTVSQQITPICTIADWHELGCTAVQNGTDTCALRPVTSSHLAWCDLTADVMPVGYERVLDRIGPLSTVISASSAGRTGLVRAARQRRQTS
jgi:hypothetical protein